MPPALPDKDVLAETYEWFVRARPDCDRKDFLSQLGVHCEEVNEMLIELTALDTETAGLLEKAKSSMHALAEHLKHVDEDEGVFVEDKNQVNYLDALLDQIVTATGCGQISGFDMVGGLNEVNRSNFSKFVNGKAVKDPVTAKIQKGPDYKKANLEPFV